MSFLTLTLTLLFISCPTAFWFSAVIVLSQNTSWEGCQRPLNLPILEARKQRFITHPLLIEFSHIGLHYIWTILTAKRRLHHAGQS